MRKQMWSSLLALGMTVSILSPAAMAGEIVVSEENPDAAVISSVDAMPFDDVSMEQSTEEQNAAEQDVAEQAVEQAAVEQAAVAATMETTWEYTVDSKNHACITGYNGTDTELVIPAELDGNSVTGIGEYVFQGYADLTSVTFPNTLEVIGTGAFIGCSSLTTLSLPESVKVIGAGAFDSCVKLTAIDLPKRMKTIGYGAFGGCSSLTDITIPDGVTKIEQACFYDCSRLKTVTLPNGLKTIEENAFDGCSSLTDIDLPDSVETIEKEAFEDCTSLVSIVLPKSLKAIEREAFENCTSLTTVAFPECLKKIGAYAFDGCSSLKKIRLSNNVKTIGRKAFRGCTALRSANLGRGVESIGRGAFADCESLTTIKIPRGVKTIENDTFENCTSLTEIKLRRTLETIKGSAFQGCNALKTVNYAGTKQEREALTVVKYGNSCLLDAEWIYRTIVCKGMVKVDLSAGMHEMRICGVSYGMFTFACTQNGWTVQNEQGQYLSFDNGALVLANEPFVWQYDNGKLYTTTKKTVQHKYGWWCYTTTKTVYWYLTGNGKCLTVSNSGNQAELALYDAVESNEHCFGDWMPCGDGKHSRTCTVCNEVETEDCTHKDSACTGCDTSEIEQASVSVTAEVTRHTTHSVLWWCLPTTTWTANITATGEGVDVETVEYSLDGENYKTGTCFTSKEEICTFYIRVTDSKDNVTNWTYADGEVTQVTNQDSDSDFRGGE